MREILKSVFAWKEESRKIALATVVKVYGSAPRPLGSKMAVNDQMDFAGSVSGGCVEGNVIENAMSVMKTGRSRLVHYGIADETAWGLGLACGGEIEVFIELFHDPGPEDEFSQISSQILQIVENSDVGAVLTILSGEYLGEKLLAVDNEIMYSGERWAENDILLERLRTVLKNQKPVKGQVKLEDENADYFIDIIAPQSTLIVVGGVHIAIPLVHMANIIGFKTVVMDSRSVFASQKRFPHADELVIDWPAKALKDFGINKNTFLVFLSHDDKMDNPALQIALESNARYIGALGSRKTHQKRIKNLTEMGVREETLERIHAPIGINIGAFGAEQIALSILAEITAVQNGVR